MVVLDTVIPVFVLIAVGYLAARTLSLDVRPFARLGVYVLGPAVILNAIAPSNCRWPRWRAFWYTASSGPRPCC